MSPAPFIPKNRRPNDVPNYLLLPEVKNLFWSRVAVGKDNECWPWTGNKHSGGYGLFWCPILQYGIRTHRVAYFYVHGKFPQEARHTCDNPPCCNPVHIINGNHQDNMRDCVERGRFPRGEANGKAKLTRNEVQKILRDSRSSRKIAPEYGVTKSTIDRKSVV